MLLPRTLSVDLWTADAAKDSLIFVDCLVQLPNLRTLEILSANRVSLAVTALEWKCAQLPSICELWVNGVSVPLVESFPSVESVMISSLDPQYTRLLCLFRNGLKRLKCVAGIPPQYVWRGELRLIPTCSPKSPGRKSLGSGQISKRFASGIRPRICISL